MAIKPYSAIQVINSNAFTTRWNNMTANDTGQPLDTRDYSDISVQSIGDLGDGNMTIQTSGNAQDWCTLRDNLGVPIVINSTNQTTARLLMEHMRYVRCVADADVVDADTLINLVRGSTPAIGV